MSFAAQAALAERLIKKNGATTTIRQPQSTVADEKTDKTTILPPIDHTAVVVVLPYQAPKSDTVQASSLVLSKFRKVLIAPSIGVVPEQNWELFWDNKWWQINGVAPLNPDGALNIMYTAIVQIP